MEPPPKKPKTENNGSKIKIEELLKVVALNSNESISAAQALNNFLKFEIESDENVRKIGGEIISLIVKTPFSFTSSTSNTIRNALLSIIISNHRYSPITNDLESALKSPLTENPSQVHAGLCVFSIIAPFVDGRNLLPIIENIRKECCKILIIDKSIDPFSEKGAIFIEILRLTLKITFNIAEINVYQTYMHEESANLISLFIQINELEIPNWKVGNVLTNEQSQLSNPSLLWWKVKKYATRLIFNLSGNFGGGTEQDEAVIRMLLRMKMPEVAPDKLRYFGILLLFQIAISNPDALSPFIREIIYQYAYPVLYLPEEMLFGRVKETLFFRNSIHHCESRSCSNVIEYLGGNYGRSK